MAFQVSLCRNLSDDGLLRVTTLFASFVIEQFIALLTFIFLEELYLIINLSHFSNAKWALVHSNWVKGLENAYLFVQLPKSGVLYSPHNVCAFVEAS